MANISTKKHTICPNCKKDYGPASEKHPVVELKCDCGYGKAEIENGVWLQCRKGLHLVRQPGTNYKADGEIWHVPLIKGLYCNWCQAETV